MELLFGDQNLSRMAISYDATKWIIHGDSPRVDNLYNLHWRFSSLENNCMCPFASGTPRKQVFSCLGENTQRHLPLQECTPPGKQGKTTSKWSRNLGILPQISISIFKDESMSKKYLQITKGFR